MNGLEIAVIAILGLSAYAGYKKGFLRVVYSILSWVIILAFVTWATPYITEYLDQNTRLRAHVQEKCIEHIQEKADKELEEGIEESITDFIMKGIAFFITLSVAGIVTGVLVNVIDLISFLPIIHSTNKLLGVVAGAIRGLLVVWLGMYAIALTSTNDMAEQLHIYIEESPFLLYLYDNNLILNIIMYFI